MRQSQIVQSAFYGSDTVVTWVLTHAVLSLGTQLGIFPLQNMSGQNLIRHNLSSVHVSCLFFPSRPKNNLQLTFVKKALNFIVVFYAEFQSV